MNEDSEDDERELLRWPARISRMRAQRASLTPISPGILITKKQVK